MMAKRIKFPLEMKDGNKVRTIEEFRTYFDSEKAVMYFLNGKLQGWLEDRHYAHYYKEICRIDSKKDNILQSICEVLKIESDVIVSESIDLKKICNKNKKIEKIKQYVDDKKILDRLDSIAMNQKELDRLIENSCREVYLFEKSFIIPGTISNMRIIGINNPTLEIDSDEMIDFKSRKVIVSGVIFGNRYQKIIDDYKYEIEHRNNKKHQCYRASNIFDVRLSDQDRNESKKLFDYLENELFEVKYDIDLRSRILYEEMVKRNLYGVFDIDKIGQAQFTCMKNAHLDEAFWKFESRNS